MALKFAGAASGVTGVSKRGLDVGEKSIIYCKAAEFQLYYETLAKF